MRPPKDPKKAQALLCQQLDYLRVHYVHQPFDELAQQAAQSHGSHVD